MTELPDWLARLTIGEIFVVLLGMSAAVAATLKLLKPARQFFKNLSQIAQDWNGVPERMDGSGQVIEPARPGVMAQLETLRSQVQNSHKTNLREDIDAVHQSVIAVNTRLDEHITTTEKRRKQADELTRVVQEEIVPVAAQLKDQIEGTSHE